MLQSRLNWFWLTLPWLLIFGLFWLFPVIYSFVLGFTNYRLLASGFDWIGFENYTRLISDPLFLSSLKNTALFVAVTIPATTILSLALALLVNRRFKGRALFRSGFFLPSITSMVVIALIFTNLLQRGGYIALLVEMIGLSPPENGFLLDSATALFSIMAMDVWMSVGYYMLIFLAGLKAIPEELYEAAEISGAGSFRKFFSITLPLLRPVMLFIVVVNSIKSFQVFVEIFVMTSGKFDTSTMVYFIYNTGLTTHFDLGYASAAAYALFVIILAFSLAQFFIIRRKEAIW